MLSKILTLLTAACSALAGWLHLRRKAEAKARKEAITEAVHTGNQEAATRIHNRLLKLLFLGLLPASILLSGCSAEPPILIVNQPMVPVRLEHEGCPGWWLSDSLYEQTLLKLNELQERNAQ